MTNATEQSFLNNENIFRTLIEESPSPVGLYVGSEMRIKIANKAIVNIFGKGDDVIDKLYFELLPELKTQFIFEILNNVYNTGIAYEAREAQVNLVINGLLTTFYFNFVFTPIRNEQGNVWGVLNTAADVTELVLIRLKLKESEERKQFTLEAAEIGTWDLYPPQRIVIWDDRCKELCGFARVEEITYNDIFRYIHPEDESRVKEAVQNTYNPQSGGNYDVTFRIITVNGDLKYWIQCKGRAYFDLNNQLWRFAGIVRDVTREQSDRLEQQKLIALVENTADAIALGSTGVGVTYLNKSGYNLLGIDDPAEALTSGFNYFYDADRQLVADKILPEILQNGKWSGEIRYRDFKTGEPIPVYINSFRINDDFSDEAIGLATVARDLRPEKKAHNEQYKLLTLIDHSSDFVSLSDLDGNVSYVNAAGRIMLGIKNQQDLERHNTEYVMPAELSKVANKVTKGLMQDGKWSGEINYRHFLTGEAIPVFGTTMLVYDSATGKPQGRATIARDMRREIADTQKLNDQIKQFEFVTDFMPVQLWTARTDGQLDYANKRAVDYFGLPQNEIIGPEWITRVHPEDQDGCIAAWTNSIETGAPYQYEFKLRNKEGIYKWHLAQALPFINDGKIIKWFGTNTDIDEQKQLQRQKDDFLGIASHELKTPVTSIKAYAQVLGAMLTKEGDTRKAGMVTRMDAQVNRLTNLIGDLLDVTKINSGRLQFNKIWFDFNQVIKETVDDLQHTTQKHMLIEDFTETGQIYSDKDRISQVITNLITNAIKYSPHTDKIIVSTRLKDNEATVCVQDFGIGIPEDKKDRVFEQFYRVSGDKQHTFPGLGLGLYISSEIIKREGGRMWVNSIEGKGSTFCFALPVNGNDD
ncbi:PAS domain-containing protein [Mucilaginibacter sp. FT3.2]|uniref:PAS domain-containing protein n=1 Tax=Mucilaginibacter sp. FT3.2 TaxID=2723090 RepID=UPI00160CFA0B|nr:PAS domain-containing protein [Mucilaginibacter sp. FT3.2]MBB6234354.1 PAS domain S-box-containing protein [Mucilaginibacter sp. FT3.2]